MARTLSVECTTLRCAVDVIAEAGQDLLVLGGVVVGVADGVPTQAAPRPAPVVAPKPRKCRFLEMPRHSQMEEVRRAIGKREPTAREIGDKLTLDKGGRSRLAQVMRDMREDGGIAPVNPEARYPRYRVQQPDPMSATTDLLSAAPHKE